MRANPPRVGSQSELGEFTVIPLLITSLSLSSIDSTSEQLVHNGYGLERSNCSVPGTTLKGTNLNLLLGRLGFRIVITRSQPSALTDLQDISVGPGV